MMLKSHYCNYKEDSTDLQNAPRSKYIENMRERYKKNATGANLLSIQLAERLVNIDIYADLGVGINAKGLKRGGVTSPESHRANLSCQSVIILL